VRAPGSFRRGEQRSAPASDAIAGVNGARGSRVLAPLLIYVVVLVAAVGSLGAPLLPSIQTDYGVSVGAAQWSLTITLLAGTVATPIVGRLGGGSCRRAVLLACLAAVVVGSLLSAIPLSFALLLLGRGLQGIGLALFPLTVSIAQDYLPALRARATVGTLSVMTVAGVGIGYPLTGVVAEYAGFRAAFWVVLGLSVIAFVASAVVVPGGSTRPTERFDALGAVLLSSGLAGLLLYISQGVQWGWAAELPLVIVAGAVAIMAVWVRREFRLSGRTPLVDLRVALHRGLLVANLTALLAMISMYMLLTFVVRYIQTPTSVSYGMGASIVDSGFVLLPLAVGSFAAGLLLDYVTRWVEPQRVIPLSAIMFTVALALFAGFRDHLWLVFLVMGIAGIGNGLSFAVVPRVIAEAVPRGEAGRAVAFNQVLQRLGSAIGSALAATVLTAHSVASSASPANSGYTSGCIVGIVLCALTGAVGWALGPSRGLRQHEAAVDEQLCARDV